MLSRILRAVIFLAAAAAVTLATGARAAQNAEQVVFSGVGTGTFDSTETSVKFWVWCLADSCTIWNEPDPVCGPRNTVQIECAEPSGSAVSETAIVNVTGPPEEE